jgi:hypothetical protein
MNKFNIMSDDKLKNWIYFYEEFPIIRLLITQSQYEMAIQEAYTRFKDYEFIYKCFYFTCMNKKGSTKNYLKWVKELTNE